MSIIQVTPKNLHSEANRLLKYKNQHEQEMNRLRILVNTLSSQWKGEAQTAFVNKFNFMEYTYRNFAELLDSYALLMKSAADQLQQTDNNMKNQIRNI